MLALRRTLMDVVEMLLAMLLAPRTADPPPVYSVREPGAERYRVFPPPRHFLPAAWRVDRATARRRSRRALQASVLLAATVPVAAGLWGVVTAVDEPVSGLASHERYLSGLLLAIGLAFWSTVPDIERKTGRFALLTALVVAGGLCRLIGVAAGDPLSAATTAALVMELVATPILCLWVHADAR